jgi:hypothetical protein
MVEARNGFNAGMSLSGSCKENADCAGIKVCGVLNYENKALTPFIYRYCMYEDVCGRDITTGDGKDILLCVENANRELKI